MTYEKMRPSLKTGDLVLFGGSSLFSQAIKAITKSKWSHVGMVLRLANFPMVLCWESTALIKTKDLQTGKPDNGVQMTPLSQRVYAALSAGHAVGIRVLSDGLSQKQLDELARLREEWKDIEYERNLWELIKAAWDGPEWLQWLHGNTEDLSSVFCSELVAAAYRRMGVNINPLPSNEYTPADFAGDNYEWVNHAFAPLMELEG